MSQPLQPLVGLQAAEISELVSGREDASFRGKQIAKWMYQKAAGEFALMNDVPQALRKELGETYCVDSLEVSRHLVSTDGVEKLLVHSGDNQAFECVMLPYEDRVSCCLSSQVGCIMGCAFCATGLGGFDRNLTAGEIVAQYLLLQRMRKSQLEQRGAERETQKKTGYHQTSEAMRERISHVVFMGMGEPLLNFKNLLKAMRILHDEVGLSYRHITVSTVGIVPQIRELAAEGLPIHLALSLHSPFDTIRDQLMPVNKKWKVSEVMGAMRDYMGATGRKITIEYLLIDNLTDTPDQAVELARLVKGVPHVVNVIPFNYVSTKEGFQRPTRERVKAFKRVLKERGANVTERQERGHDIAAACGQLAGQHKGVFAGRARSSELPLVS